MIPQTHRTDIGYRALPRPGALYWAENSAIKSILPGAFVFPPSRERLSFPLESNSASHDKKKE